MFDAGALGIALFSIAILPETLDPSFSPSNVATQNHIQENHKFTAFLLHRQAWLVSREVPARLQSNRPFYFSDEAMLIAT
jgi:hypothetical protein